MASASAPTQSPPFPSLQAPPPPSPDEIAFFDVETTVPSRVGQRHALLEFGAILVCPRRLVEVRSYSTLIRPADLSAISTNSVRCNGIRRVDVEAAPTFAQVADSIYAILHGRVWAGHNIVRFDCPRIRAAFAEIGRPAPEPKGTIDSLPLLTQKFGRRAGNMKMATLADYFGLGKQKHRSLDDVRMNLEVLKYCATVLFLETSILEHSSASYQISSTMPTASNGNLLSELISVYPNPASYVTSNNQESVSSLNSSRIGICDLTECSALASNTDPIPLEPLIEQMQTTSIQIEADEERLVPIEGLSKCIGFLEPDRISNQDIHATVVRTGQHGVRTVLLYKDSLLQFCCEGLRVHYRISRKFLDHAGRPKINIVLDAPASLCQLLDFCDNTAQRACLNSGSRSEWRTFMKKDGFLSSSTIRLNMPTTTANSNTPVCSTEIYKWDACGNHQKLFGGSFDAGELDSLFTPGAIVDAYFSVDTYDFQQCAGIRLVAKRLVVHPK